jgi:hypothetical protein
VCTHARARLSSFREGRGNGGAIQPKVSSSPPPTPQVVCASACRPSTESRHIIRVPDHSRSCTSFRRSSACGSERLARTGIHGAPQLEPRPTSVRPARLERLARNSAWHRNSTPRPLTCICRPSMRGGIGASGLAPTRAYSCRRIRMQPESIATAVAIMGRRWDHPLCFRRTDPVLLEGEELFPFRPSARLCSTGIHPYTPTSGLVGDSSRVRGLSGEFAAVAVGR